jgi:gamma-glutamyltranspeptidase/glutathione hydrolase
MANRGAVACGHSETARAAATILAEGGNAFDAALAAMCTACVAEPVLASLGGGGFLAVQPAVGRLAGRQLVYDFFPQTPKRREPESTIDFHPVVCDFGPSQQQFHIGMGSIATPGAVKGLFEAHRDLGCMPMRRIVEPAVALAREGVTVDAMQAYMFGVVGAILTSTDESRALFASNKRPGELLAEGDRFAVPAFADALEILAIEGPDLFYRGEIAQRIARDARALGGYLTLADLEGYRVERRRPLDVDIFDARIALNPPPSTGGILIAFALQLLRGIEREGVRFASPSHLQWLGAAMAATNRARLESGLQDTDGDRASTRLLDPVLVDQYRARVLGRPQASGGTTHISVVDGVGNAASLSLSNGEGSGYVVPETGIMLNNMLGEEDINPQGFHCWPADTRLGSMMAPAVVQHRDGRLMVLGSGGSKRIRTAILQVLVNHLALRLPLANAVAAPRIHVEEDKVSVEPGFEERALAALANTCGGVETERWPERNMFFGGVHAVCREPGGGLSGAGDERRDGVFLLA